VKFTCWGAEGAIEGGKGIDRILLNISRDLNALAHAQLRRQFVVFVFFTP
jgi:hypothetical protein